jgi:murein DD-endopeptidase MepM/ murein hydrolase activator NlpD
MDSKHHTIIVVPHARARFRKFRLTSAQLIGSAVALAVATITSIVLVVTFLTSDTPTEDLAKLRAENEALKAANEGFEASLSTLRTQLSEYEDRTRKLAIVAGLDSLVGGESGLGGTEMSLEGPRPSPVDELATRAQSLGAGLDAVAEQLDVRMRWISATPSLVPTKGLFTSGFGGRRDPITSRPAFHSGLDISAPIGTPIIATADGVVTLAGWDGSLGKSVRISHGFGVQTRYGHMSKLDVQAGQKVKRGQIIGYVGTTGRSTGAHLHYEVYRDGEAVDPLAYILTR